MIAARDQLLPAWEREENIPCDLNDTAWFEKIDGSEGAVFFAAGVFYGNTAQFGKKPQPGFLAQFKVWKTKEYCMYFSFFKLKKWGKKTAAARRHNCAVLP